MEIKKDSVDFKREVAYKNTNVKEVRATNPLDFELLYKGCRIESRNFPSCKDTAFIKVFRSDGTLIEDWFTNHVGIDMSVGFAVLAIDRDTKPKTLSLFDDEDEDEDCDEENESEENEC